MMLSPVQLDEMNTIIGRNHVAEERIAIIDYNNLNAFINSSHQNKMVQKTCSRIIAHTLYTEVNQKETTITEFMEMVLATIVKKNPSQRVIVIPGVQHEYQ